MKTFLQEIAERLIRDYPAIHEVTLVFPNRRAILYFRKHLAELLSKPVFAPRMVTIEGFIGAHTTLVVPDKLELVHRLYKVYQQHLPPQDSQEPFDQFFFWGDMLLRDFDETDRYMVNAEMMFKDLSHQKELDASFDFLTAEQLEFLKTFWSSFEVSVSEHKKNSCKCGARCFPSTAASTKASGATALPTRVRNTRRWRADWQTERQRLSSSTRTYSSVSMRLRKRRRRSSRAMLSGPKRGCFGIWTPIT
ncbi:MAG: hypothetical protein HC859_02325 [Bacteroidia bacterium]|nr:hypothetical protein [Bacteroidia bacterium]